LGIFNFFFKGGAIARRKGGACAMAQWHNGQSKSDDLTPLPEVARPRRVVECV